MTDEVEMIGEGEITEDPVENHDYFEETISPNKPFHDSVLKLDRKLNTRYTCPI